MFDFNKNHIKNIINNFNNSRILVVGDLAIDEMVYGQTARISREAPVLILKHTETKVILGAASNAANNISTLNKGKVTAIGVYNNDYHGPILLSTLQEANIDTSLMVVDGSRPTTTKTRISGSCAQSVTQQIVRIDRESNVFVADEVEQRILENIKKAIPEHDAVILSDYGIGMMTTKIIETTISLARKHNKIVAVDAQSELERFKGATVLTPNQPDAEKAVGYSIKDRTSLLKAGNDLLEQTQADMILLTRGGEGMMLFEKNGNISGVPAFNRTDVFDVTGAGDTVVASFTLGLAAGGNGFDAAIIGNTAASIVIRHFGCATTSQDEIIHNLEKLDMKSLSIKAN